MLQTGGDDLTRANVMKQAASMKDVELPLLLPGIAMNTSPTDYFPIEQMQLQKFDGAKLGALRRHPRRLVVELKTTGRDREAPPPFHG